MRRPKLLVALAGWPHRPSVYLNGFGSGSLHLQVDQPWRISSVDLQFAAASPTIRKAKHHIPAARRLGGRDFNALAGTLLLMELLKQWLDLSERDRDQERGIEEFRKSIGRWSGQVVC